MTEKAEGRSGLPSWQVRGKTFLRMGPKRTVATIRLPKESATIIAAAHPEYALAVHRRGGDRTYLGREVRLRGASGARLSLWVLEAWAATAPRNVVRRFLARGGRLPRRPRPPTDRL